MSVEPSVLSEETIVQDDTYKEVRESFVTWDDRKLMSAMNITILTNRSSCY